MGFMSSIGSSTSDPGLPSEDPVQKLGNLIEQYSGDNTHAEEISNLVEGLLIGITSSKRGLATDSLIARIHIELGPKIDKVIPRLQGLLQPKTKGGKPHIYLGDVESETIRLVVKDLTDLLVVTKKVSDVFLPVEAIKKAFLENKLNSDTDTLKIKYLIMNSPKESTIYDDFEAFFNKVPYGKAAEFIEILLSKNPNFILNNLVARPADRFSESLSPIILKFITERELIEILGKVTTFEQRIIISRKNAILGQKIGAYIASMPK